MEPDGLWGFFPKSVFGRQAFPMGSAAGECGSCNTASPGPAAWQGGDAAHCCSVIVSTGAWRRFEGSHPCKEGEIALVIVMISWGHLSEPLFLANNTAPIDADLVSVRSHVVHASMSHDVPPEPGTGEGPPCSSIFPLCFRRDGRLTAGDELLMINGQSLVGLSHQDAVALLRSAAGLVQLVVASKVRCSPWWSPERTSTGVCAGAAWKRHIFDRESHVHVWSPKFNTQLREIHQ